jgi:hypothetical protein
MAFRFISNYKECVVPYESIQQSGSDFSLIYDGEEKSPTGEYIVEVRQYVRLSPNLRVMAEEYEDSCLSLPHIIRSEPRTAEEKNPKSRHYKPVTFRFPDLNFGTEASGNPWILKFDVSARTEFHDGFRNVCIGTLMTDEIHVGYNSPEEAAVRQTHYCHICKIQPCRLRL